MKLQKAVYLHLLDEHGAVDCRCNLAQTRGGGACGPAAATRLSSPSSRLNEDYASGGSYFNAMQALAMMNQL